MKHANRIGFIKFLSLVIGVLLVGGGMTRPIEAGITAPGIVATLDGSNNLVVTDNNGGNDPFIIRYDGSVYSLRHLSGDLMYTTVPGIAGSGSDTLKIPATAVSGSQIIINAGLGNDTLTIDIQNNSTPFAKNIVFNGEGPTSGVGDDLILTGTATIADADFQFTNETDGTIDLTGNATIAYTGLEPITSSITAANITLNYGGLGEKISVSNAGGGQTTVDSNVGGETVTFVNPTTKLTINAGGGDDQILINSLTSSYPANLVVAGEADADVIEVSGSIKLAAGRNASFTAEDIGQTLSGDILLSGTLLLDAGSTGGIVLTNTSNNVGTLGITDADTADFVNENDLILETITTQSSFYVESRLGALSDGTGDETVNVTTDDAALRASTGIGSAATDEGDIDIQVLNLAAETGQGDLAIEDSGYLNITTVDGLSGLAITAASGGDILVRDGTTGGNELLDIMEPISNAGSGGDITIYADGNTDADDLEIEDDITANGGDILLVAFGTIDFNNTPDVLTTGNGTISVHAGATFSYTAGISLTGGTIAADLTGAGDYSLYTDRGDITLTSPDLINVETINADTDGVGAKGTVRIWADIDGNGDGEIFDTESGETVVVTAGTLIMRSATGIADVSGLETAVDILVAENSGNGGVIVYNTSATLTTGSGLGVSGISNNNSFVNSTVISTTGDFYIDTPIVSAVPVSITAVGDIVDLNDSGTDISGDTVFLDGNLSPGGSGVGVLTIVGATTVASSGGFEVDLTGSTTAGPHDQLNVTGDVAIQSGAVFTYDLSAFTTYESGAITVIDNSGSFLGSFAGWPHLTQTNPGNTPNFVVEYGSMVLRAYLAVTPTVGIDYAGPSTATLTWDDFSSHCSYTGFRSTDPYQGESAPSIPAVSPLDDSGAGMNNYFYTVRANGCAGDTALSGEVGVFHFELEPGS